MKKIIFCGGGSAGHVMPNIALIESLNGKYEPLYLGTDGIEKDICKKFNIPFMEFSGVKLVRGKFFCNLTIPVKLIKSKQRCKEILKKEQPSLLFCKGGYASLPPALAASSLGIPILTHESDLSAGLANKIIARRAERILTSFKPTAARFNNGAFTGSPIRECLFGRDKVSAHEKFNLDFRPTLLVFGGGSGSQKINAAIREILIPLSRKYNVLHICGKGNIIETNLRGYRQFEFYEDMGELYACADYAVARCGSNSAFELLALKIPTLFIPLQNSASRGDQVQNAEYFRNKGLCKVLYEKDLCKERLLRDIDELIADDKLKTTLRNNSAECGNENIKSEIERALKKV